MTLQEAINRAESLQTELSHEHLNSGRWYTPEKVIHAVVPVFVATSNEWKVRPRLLTVREDKFREQIIPVLRRVLARSEVDRVMLEIQDAMYDGNNFVKEERERNV